MNKLYLAIIVIVIGAIAGWYAFGSGSGIKVNLPRLSDFNAPKKVIPTPTPYGTDGGSLYRYEEIAVTGSPSAISDSKGGLPLVTVTPRAVLAGKATIQYLDSGFVPQILTVKVNTAVTFVNSSSQEMWVASNNHPDHEILPSLDQKKAVANGGTYEYTFDKIGTWIYHNHLYPNKSGTVIVKK